MARAERISGALLLGLAAMSVGEALRIKDDWQGARLMPMAVGIALALLGAGHLLPWPRAARDAGERVVPDRDAASRVALVFGALAIYVLVLPSLGFLLATGTFLLALLRLLGASSWPATVGLAAATALASHAVFKAWLGMPLPSGPLGL